METWAIIVAIVVAWYLVAIPVMCRLAEINGWNRDQEVTMWTISPAVALVAALAIVFWPLTRGAIQPPWKW